MRHCNAMLVALALSLVVNATPADEAAAAFKRGRESMAKGRLADACAAFDESHRLDPALGALLNLAECTYKLEQHARAWTVYGEVLAWANRTGNQARASVAQERLSALRPKVALVVVDSPTTDGVFIDRVKVVPGQTLALDPGAHVVEFKRAGTDTETRTITVTGGETLTLSRTAKEDAPRRVEPAPVKEPLLIPSPAPAPVTVTAAPAPPPATTSRAGPLSLLIAGGVVSTAALITFGYATDVWNRGEAQRQGGALTVTRREYELAGQLYPVSMAGLIAGPVLLAAGTLWWLLTN